MKSQDPTKSVEQMSIWPDDWFIYDQGKVSGPFTADEAFLNPAEGANNRLVSRKGFTQWYPLRDFVHLYKFAAAAKDSKLPNFTQQGPKVEARSVGPISVAPPPVDPNLSLAHYMPEKVKEPARVEPTLPDPVEIPNQAVVEKPSVSLEPTNVEQEYLVSKGRIRLGVIRNSFASSVVFGICTLGLFYPFWYRRAMMELNFHGDGSQKKTSFFTGMLLLIPILHLIPVYKVARKILEIESQNNLKSTSPMFALVISLIPFAGICYLQMKINRHWIAHARHAFAQRIASKNQ